MKDLVYKFKYGLPNFIVILLFILVFTHYQVWSTTWKVKAVPPGFSRVDYEGLYVVDGDKVDIIQGRFVIFGSLLVKDNATLILRNAEIQIFRPGLYEPPTIKNTGKLIMENSEISTSIWGTSEQGWETVKGADSILLKDDTELNVSHSSRIRWSFITALDKARISFQNSNVEFVKSYSNVSIINSYTDWLEISEGSSFSIINSSVNKLICRTGTKTSFVSITDSHIKDAVIENAKSEIDIGNSVIEWLQFRESSFSVSISDSTIGLSLTLSEKNLTWTVKPFFAKLWNIRRDTPLNIEEGNLTLTDTNVDKIALRFSDSSVFLRDSKLYGLASESSRIYIIDSSFEEYISMWYSSVFLYDSTVKSLGCYDSNVTVVNSITEKIDRWSDSMIEIWWHLKVVVNDQAESPKPKTLVKVLDSNGKLVEQKIVNSKGLTQFTLLEKRMSGNETAFLGNYTIHAEYDSWSAEEQIALQDSQTIFLTVTPFHVRLMQFIATPTGVTISIAITLLTITVLILVKRRYIRHR